jgi:hypothetical protein
MEVHLKKLLREDFLPVQACVYLILCIFIICKTTVQARNEAVQALAVIEYKLFISLKKLFLLAGLKNFKHAGLLIYLTEKPWQDGEGKMLNTDFKT